MIEDKELRALFRAESDEHLQGLEDSVLALEKTPGDTADQGDAMRHAHSLKGAARMLGLGDIEKLAHRLEDLFRGSEGQPALDPDRFDVLFKAIDGLKALCREAVSAKTAETDVPALLREIDALSSNDPTPSDASGGQPADEANNNQGADDEQHTDTETRARNPDKGDAPRTTAKSRPVESSAPRTTKKPPAVPTESDEQIQTIRVRTQDLDRLLTDAGELTVTRHRLHHHIERIEALAEAPTRIVTGLGQAREATAQRNHHGQEDALVQLTNHCRRELAALQRELSECVRHLVEDHSRLEMVNRSLESRINDIRMLPLSTLFDLFPRTVRDLAQAGGKRVRLVTQGMDTTADKRIIEGLKDPVMHLIRNAVDHGIESPETRRAREKDETGTIVLRGYQSASRVVIEVLDDGKGLNREAIRQKAIEKGLHDPSTGLADEHLAGIITRPGFSTVGEVTEVSGRGVGLDVVARRIAELKGHLDIASREGEGCRIRMRLPVSLATTKVVLLQLGERLLALPTEVIVTTGRTRPEAIVPVGGRMSLNIDGDAVPVIRLANALDLPRRAPDAPEGSSPVLEHYLIIAEGERRAVLLVDDVLEEQQVIVKPPGAFIRHLRCIAGACILRSGDIAMVLRTTDLLTTPTRSVSGDGAGSEAPSAEPETVLLVEDSAVTRIQEKRILENAGYRVVPATDGQEALERLEHADIDLVVTDISMPRMDGLALTAHIRKHPRHHQLPVILMTMLDRKEDRQRGLEAGADAYLMKTSFDQNELLDTVRRLL